MHDLLLIVDEPGGRRRRLPIRSGLRIGGSGSGVLPLGTDQPAARIELRDDGAWLVPLGGADVRLNDAPVDVPVPITLGDTLAVGDRTARVAPGPRIDVVDRPGRIVAAIETARTPSATDLGASLRARPSLERNLAILRELGDLLATVHDEEELLDRVLDLLVAALPADRAAVISRPAPGGAPQPRAVRFRRERLAHESFPISRAILERVLDGESAVLGEDGSAGAIRSVIAAPVRGRGGLLGALYLDASTSVSTDALDENDLETVTALGLVTGIALDNVRVHRESVASANMAAVGKTVAGLAHDIRNAMSGLRTGVFLLNKELSAHPEKPIREAWNLLERTQETVARLVDDMVSFSKERAPEYTLEDLAAVVEGAVSLCRERAKQKHVRLDVAAEPLPRFELERRGVERCVLNLVGNAIDAAGENGRVTVSITRDGDDALLAVADDGPGVREADRERIFDLLFSTKGARGTGFGLSITRKIVEEHGGRVELESELGRGSTFRVRLPRRNAEKAPAP